MADQIPAETQRYQAKVDVVQAIRSRRSIRRGFRTGLVDREVVESIVSCGLAAPSSKDTQPWCIHVVRDRSLLEKLSHAMISNTRKAEYVPTDPRTGKPLAEYDSSVDESARVIREVPLCLFIENLSPFTGGRRKLASSTETFDEAIIGYGFELVGIGAAVENMLLAAHALGVSGVFMGDVLIAEAEVAQALELQGDLVGVVALGVSRAEPAVEKKVAPGRVRWHS